MYTDRKTAPLVYHNFIKYFALPVSILACAAMFVAGIIYESLLGIAFSIPMLALHIAAFVGFLKWRYYGMMCFLAGAVLALIFELIAATDGGGNVLLILISGAIYLGTLIIYYSKREELFDRRNAIHELENCSCEEPSEAMAESLEQNAHTPESGVEAQASGKSFFARHWKCAAVIAAALIVGIFAGMVFSNSKIKNLSERITSLEELCRETNSDYLDAVLEQTVSYNDGHDVGYSVGYDDGYNEGSEEWYASGYEAAVADTAKSINQYIATLDGAIDCRDWQSIEHLLNMNPEDIARW